MAVATMDSALLQAADGKAERIRDKVGRCHRATAAIVWSLAILPELREMRRKLEEIRSTIGVLKISTDEDRGMARDYAKRCMDIAKKIESIEGDYKQNIKTVWPIFNFITNANVNLLDETYCLVEDVAEALALVSSKEFMVALESDLRRTHGTA